jgi:Mrp family chromosome partitioning ATPase
LGVTLQAWPPARRGGAIAREIVAYHQPDHPISKQYGELFARMIEDLAPASPALLLALGVKPQVGTTTVLLNVAVSGAAAQTHRLIVVDANWARPALTQRLGLGAPPGLADFFAGSLALEQAAVPVLPQLHVLAPGAKPLTEKALASPAMSWIVSWLRERYDVILVDGPDLAEARHIAPLVTAADGAYLILPQGAAPPNQTLLTPLAGKVRGLIHTHFEPL